jgi:hypothetical protein
MYRELKTKHPKKNNPIKKWANELNRDFPKEDVHMANKYMKKMLTIPGHKRHANQNHIKILFHFCLNSYHQEHNM